MKFIIFGLIVTLTLVQAEISLKPRNIYGTINPKKYNLRYYSRIVGGEEVEPHSIPYQVALFINVDGDTFFCGGSLISPKTVLTAAHCGEGASSIQVILGAHQVRQQEDTQVRLEAAEILVHPDWDSTSLVNDLCILILPEEVKLNDNIQTISLPANNNNDYAGDLATTSGWGKDSDQADTISPVLRKVQLPIITNDICGEFYLDIQPGHICASGQDGKSTCSGDSGGPLVASSGEQIGITSFGSIAGCEVGFPPAFTRVSEYLGWINDNTQ